MAINFEAANMAGYNNPKIEVFKAVFDGASETFTSAPSKPEIIRCLNRGSIPVIVMVTNGIDAGYVFYLFGWGTQGAGSIIFLAGSALTGGDLKISYNPDSDTPVFSTTV